MKLLKNLFPILLVMLLWSSCGEDDGIIPPVNDAPTSSISPSAVIILPHGTATVLLSGTAVSTNPLNSLTIQKDNASISDFSTVIIDGAAINSSTILLFDGDKSTFTKTIQLVTTLNDGESSDYSFTIIAEDGQTTTEIVTVTAEEVTPVNVRPEITLTADLIATETHYQGQVLITKGSAPLATAAVYRDGIIIDPSMTSITLGAMTTWSENPYTLPAEWQDSIHTDLIVNLPTISGTYTHMFIVTDTSGLTDTLEWTHEVILDTELIAGATGDTVYNRNGPLLGGFNAITGTVGGFSDQAHIHDNGIDGDGNWLSQIQAGPLTQELRKVNDGSTFGDYTYQHQVQDIYTTSTTGAQFDANPGDLFVAFGDNGVYYLIHIERKHNTTNDNRDFFVVSAKY